MTSVRPRAGRLDPTVLAAIAFVAGFGSLTVTTVAERVSASMAAPLVLVLIAVVAALPGTLRPSAARRQRVELARLRGMSGWVAGWRAVRGLVLVAIVGTASGAAIGWLLADRTVDRVAPGEASVTVPSSAWIVVAIAAVALGLVALSGAIPLARAPMAELVLPRRVHADADRFGVVLRVLLVVVAAVAVYQARSVGGEWRAIGALGLAAVGCGVLADLLVRWGSAHGCRSVTRTGALRPEVALRRIGHPARGATAFVVPVVAAAVIAIVVAAGWSAAGTWREDTARIGLGGPTRYAADGSALTVLEAVRETDPDGRWLMPVAVFRDDPDGPERRVYVDTERYARVSGEFLSGTDAAQLDASVDELRTGEGVVPLSGDRMSFELHAPDGLTVYDLTIRVSYTNDNGDFVNVELPVTDARGDGDIDAGASLRIDDCTTACAIADVTFEGYGSERGVPLEVGPFMLGDTNVWQSAEWQKQAGSAGRFEPTDTGVDVTFVTGPGGNLGMAGSIPVTGDRSLVVEPASSPTLPVITAGDQSSAKRLKLIDGEVVPVEAVATAAALPVIGANGSMFDLPRALAGHAHSSVGMETFVLARADTPDSVIDELGGSVDLGARVTYADALAVTDRSTSAVESRMMTLVGGLGVLIALTSLLGSTRRLRPALRRESGALHLAGLNTAMVRAIGRWELALTIGWVALAVLVSSWVTGQLMLGALPFIGSAALIPAPSLAMPIGSAVGSAIVVAVLTGVIRWVAVNASASTPAGERR